MKRQNVINSILAAEMILLIPLAAMMFTGQVDWSQADFIFAATLLSGVGVAYAFVVEGIKSNPKLTVIGIVLAAVIILVWIELAVGMFGSPIAGS